VLITRLPPKVIFLLSSVKGYSCYCLNALRPTSGDRF
jgi:hypothetical protein